jgi:hypothetical protein
MRHWSLMRMEWLPARSPTRAEAIAGRDAEVIQVDRRVEVGELAHGDLADIRRQTAGLAGVADPEGLGLSASEGRDHSYTLSAIDNQSSREFLCLFAAPVGRVGCAASMGIESDPTGIRMLDFPAMRVQVA